MPAAYAEATGVYSNKAPGGIAYRCSFRVTEAIYLMERTMDVLADELGMDPVELRRKNFVKKEQMPYVSVMGWEYDGGDYEGALQEALRIAGYEELLEEQKQAREEGRIMGIGLSTFTEIVGAGPGKKCHIAGIEMFDAAELRIHPTGKAILKLGVKSQGQGHETTFAQIVAGELGIPAENVEVREGDTDNTPFGLGTYGSRSTPVCGAATAVVSRKVQREGEEDSGPSPRSRRGRPGVRGRALPGQGLAGPGRRPWTRSPSPLTRTSPKEKRPASRPSPTTIRRR